jgi:putative copper resistance protein D
MLRLIVIWLHIVAAAAWIGGLLHTMHLIAPAAARGGRESLELLVRGRPMAWGALAILVLTGLENLRTVGLSPWLAAKLMAVIALLALAAHRDFAVLPRAIRVVAEGAPSAAALSGVRALDRVLLLLTLAALFLAVGVARGR